MKVLGAYFSRHWKLLVLLGGCLGICSAVFYLYGLPLESVGYAFVLCFALGLALFAAGYFQFLRRHRELEGLLDELFLYTRLQSEAAPLECRETTALPPLWDALAEFYPQLEAAGVEPALRFDRENLTVWASPEALGRVYRNLIANALRHGGGGLAVSGREGELCFSNDLLPGSAPDPERLFDRFYQGSPARAKGGAGLGLSIVRELMEQMGGRVSANIAGGRLEIHLSFPGAPPREGPPS